MKDNKLTIQYIKQLGKEKNESVLDELFEYYRQPIDLELKREVVSSIGRNKDNDRVYNFLKKNVFKKIQMELVYQMYRTCLYKGKEEKRFKELGEKIKNYYNNENIEKMEAFFNFKLNKGKHVRNISEIKKPTLLVGDSEETLKKINDGEVQMIFTSPPYYNAKEYSDYKSYKEYLEKIKRIFLLCNKVLEDGRFIIVNISPVITKRAGREFESIRYPIHYDYHRILEEAGFYFIDEIIWIKPEPSVPNRIGGYMQTRRPLSYKPNCITESLMVYRKKCDFLLDKNIKLYKEYDRYDNEEIDSSNCWYIAPKSDKNHPAVFPEELCYRVLKYYSYKNDIVLDPFAGSGTLGDVALKMGRIPILCELNEGYINLIKEKFKYDII
jgi:M4C-methyltransferase, putative